VNVIAAVCGPGRTLYLTEKVHVGDVLHIDGASPDGLFVVWVGPGPGPYEVTVGVQLGAGMGWVHRWLLPGEPVRVYRDGRAVDSLEAVS
jgi:hypothetical protein